MATGRETKVVRYFKAKVDAKGAPIPGTEDEDVWVDMELLTKFTMETGSGASYRRDNWVLDWSDANENRNTEWKKIYKDRLNDPDTWVPVPVPKSAKFDTGSGASYRRFRLTFDNTVENERRKNTIMRVFHAEFGSGGVDVDKDDYIDVETINRYAEDYGAGASYVLENWVPDNSTVPFFPDLPPDRYRVKENPNEQGPLKVWPSHREKR